MLIWGASSFSHFVPPPRMLAKLSFLFKLFWGMHKNGFVEISRPLQESSLQWFNPTGMPEDGKEEVNFAVVQKRRPTTHNRT
jgi:hypothetical protein